MITTSFLTLSTQVLNQYHPRLGIIMDILTVSLLWDSLTAWQSPSIHNLWRHLHDTHTQNSVCLP